jgi:hypothetical protein
MDIDVMLASVSFLQLETSNDCSAVQWFAIEMMLASVSRLQFTVLNDVSSVQ